MFRREEAALSLEPPVISEKSSGIEVLSGCWSCDHPYSPPQQNPLSQDSSRPFLLFCEQCGVLQPPLSENAFECLEFPSSYALEIEEVEKRYFQRQRQVHPDRFVGKSTQEALYAHQQAEAANRSYEILRCPLKRAQHLLESAGVTLQQPSGGSDPEDPAFLMEMMERQEELSAAETDSELMALISWAQKEQSGYLQSLEEALGVKNFPETQRYLHRLTYVRNFLRDAEQKRVSPSFSFLNAFPNRQAS